ncbi:MAG: hypothetical protein SVK08_01005 [Halobacteriota archaeon]|nr:hypothetical protein [Halobacteriota archaeon]
MSRVHITNGSYRTSVGEIDCGCYTVVFHIPITKPKGTASGIASVLPDIAADEMTQLEAGTLKEITKSVNYNSNCKDTDFEAQLLEEWSNITATENKKYDFEKKFYLSKYD